MQISSLLTVAVSCIALAFPTIAQPRATFSAPSQDLMSLTVLAEPQLALPMTEITRLYSLRQRINLLTAFDDSTAQAQKLLEGESGDVLLTSYSPVLTDLKQRGMADVYSQVTITSDQLLLAARKSDTLNDRRKLIDTLQSRPLLLPNANRYIEGLHGRETLPYLYYNTPNPPEPVFFSSRNGLYQALTSGSGIGLILQSESRRHPEIDLTVPLADNHPVLYHAVAIAGENMPLARDFISYLRSPEAQQIFARHGFSQPK